MDNVNESKAWRDLVKPLIGVLIPLCVACAAYVKSHTEISEAHDKQVEEMVLLKAQVSNNSEAIMQFRAEQNVLKSTLSDMRSDISFIRGKMEGTGK